MMNKNKLFLLSLGCMFILSCANEGGEHDTEKVAESEQPCLYSYDDASTTIAWTAFKFTEKTGVGGKFDKVNVLISAPAEDMYTTLTGASFTIPVETVNSSNEERDTKIRDHFFGSMNSTDVISGIVKDINASNATIELTMNGVSKDYKGNVNVVEDTVRYSTTINLVDFEAQVSVDSLNSVCNDLHKGADGISKLWIEVDILVTTVLKKECP